MAERSLGKAVRQLLRTLAPQSGENDFCLLDRFAQCGDEEAFEILLARHGPMVWRTCQRIVRQAADAEDAFQATFLVLCRKARSIGRRESLSGWLYQVAYRIALKAKARTRYQSIGESEIPAPATDPAATSLQTELRFLLDEALTRLPDKYRAPLLFCYLEGKTKTRAAAELGWAEGTLSSRLARGKELLRTQLLRRGVVLSATALATLLVQEGAARTLPMGLLRATLKVKSLFVLGEAAGSGGVAAHAIVLAEGAMKAMFLTKIKIAVVALVSVGLLGVGAGVATHHALAEKPAIAGQATEPKPRAQVAERPKPTEDQPPRIDRYGDPLPEGALARLGTMRFRHGWFVQSMAFSPDGKLLASSGCGRALCLWDVATGREVRQLPMRGQPQSVAFSPDGKAVVAAWGETIHLFDVASGKELRQLKGHQNGVNAVAISPDGLTLASGSHDSTVRLWEIATGKETHLLEGHNGSIYSVAFSPDGGSIASGGADKTIRIWDCATGKERCTLHGHQVSVMSVRYSPDGKLLASAALNDSSSGLASDAIRLWDVAARKEVRTLRSQALTSFSVSFSPDGAFLASGDGDGTVGLWDVATGREVRRWKVNPLRARAVAFSPDGKTIASGGVWGSDVRLWETATGREIRPFGGHHGMIESIAFLPGSKALVSHGRDKQVLWWDLATGEERVYFPELDSPSLKWQRTALSPDGRILATGDRLIKKEDHLVRLWDVATGRELRTLGKHQNAIWAILFSADGKRLATGSDDSTIAVWDVATGKEPHRLQGHRERVWALAFAPDGNTLASMSNDNTVRVWDLTTGKERYQREGQYEDGTLVFSPDGKLLVASSGYQRTPVRVWEAATGKDLASLGADHIGTYALAFTPDSRFLATGGIEGDDLIRLWEVASGQEVRRFRGHHSGVFALAFTADGRRLASGGGDSTVLLWDVRAQPDDRRRKVRLAPEELEARWPALASADAAKAYQTIWDLVAAPESAVPFLHERLQPPSSKADPQQVERWITELDSAQFAVRQKAAQALEQLGDAAEPSLRKALADRPTLEARRRLEQLIDKQEKRAHLDTLRWVRAMVILEAVATPEAQRLLRRMAQGGWTTRVSDEARASLERLAKRPAAKP